MLGTVLAVLNPNFDVVDCSAVHADACVAESGGRNQFFLKLRYTSLHVATRRYRRLFRRFLFATRRYRRLFRRFVSPSRRPGFFVGKICSLRVATRRYCRRSDRRGDVSDVRPADSDRYGDGTPLADVRFFSSFFLRFFHTCGCRHRVVTNTHLDVPHLANHIKLHIFRKLMMKQCDWYHFQVHPTIKPCAFVWYVSCVRDVTKTTRERECVCVCVVIHYQSNHSSNS